MKKFSYLRPPSIDEAFELLQEYGDDARIVAGGTDLLVEAKKGKLNAGVLVSLGRLDDLRYIRMDGGEVRIGAMTTLRDIEQSDLIAEKIPALADAARNMASVQIRNTATVAGNIANAAPSADTAPPLLVAAADVVLSSKIGSRVVPLKDFFIGPKKTALQPGEILTEFIAPIPGGVYSQAYHKHARRKAMDLAMVSVAVHLELEDDLETCRKARIAHGVAAPTPIRTPESEAQLTGQKITAELLSSIGESSCSETLCRDSIRGRAWYRQEIIRVMVRRMALLALKRAQAAGGSS